MIFKNVLLLAFLVLNVTCKKKLPPQKPYPEPTFTGQDKIVCRINGEFFETSESGSRFMGTYPLGVSYDTTTKRFDVGGSDKAEIKSDVRRGISINLGNIISTGNFDLVPKFNYYSQKYNNAKFYINNQVFSTDSTFNGTVKITKLTYEGGQGIVCGTFSFKAINTSTKEIVNITDGWFDVHYY
jgi:hypothetical protein